jgi:MFS family permease
VGIILFRFLYFFLFFGLSTIYAMLIPFLSYKGYDSVEIGVLISLYTVSGMIGQFLVGFFCDKFKTIKKIFLPSMIVIMISGTISIMFNKIIFIVGFMIMGCSNYILNTLCDSWVMEREEPIKERFGKLRAYGSIGWAFGVLTSGFVISKFGYEVLNIVFVLMIFISFFIALKLKDTKKECKKEKSSLSDLFKNKEYILTIIVLLIISISYRSYYQILPYAISNIGKTTVSFGIYSFISAISEMIMLMYASKVLKKVSPDKILILSPITIFIQLLILFIFKNIYIIYLSAILQLFTYPLILMVARIMIDRVSKCSVKTSSQLIGFAIFNSFGIVVSSLMVGTLIKYFNISYVILMIIFITILAIILSKIYDKKIKDKLL